MSRGGVIPTRAAFAECCTEQAAGQFVGDMKTDPFAVDNRKKFAVIAAVVVAVIALAACGIAWGLNNQSESEETPVAASSEVAQSTVTATVKAKGADAESTEAKVEVLASDGTAVVEVMEIPANQKAELGELPEGEYSMHVVQAPVNSDGSTYKLPEKDAAFSVANDAAPVSVEVSLEKLDADDMSKEQLEAAAGILSDNGKADNAKAVESKASTAKSKPGSANEVKTGSTASQSKPSSGTNTNNGSSSSGSSSNGGGSSSGTSSHTHNWVAVTKTVHHDAQYKTVHHDAVTKSVVICLDCGAENPGRDHLKQHVINGGNGGTTVKEVVIQNAYDEKVLVTAAYDETVTTGYKCSGCGATKK